MTRYETSLVVQRLEDGAPTRLPVLMLECDRCRKPCWIEANETDVELIDMRHVCRQCMADLIAEDPSIEDRYMGNYESSTRSMPVDEAYAKQATTAAAAMMAAYRNRESN